jgi:hypothetical protein
MMRALYQLSTKIYEKWTLWTLSNMILPCLDWAFLKGFEGILGMTGK